MGGVEEELGSAVVLGGEEVSAEEVVFSAVDIVCIRGIRVCREKGWCRDEYVLGDCGDNGSVVGAGHDWLRSRYGGTLWICDGTAMWGGWVECV